jgi:membrane associated rhomboid family serine protease
MLLPYKVDVPMERTPWANWVIMAITVITSVAIFFQVEGWEGDEEGASTIIDYFVLQPENFRVPQLVGSLLTHLGFFHLAGNMLFLWVFGNAVNAKIGHWQYVLLYLGIGIFEGIIWVMIGPAMPVVGASGAIMGIVGAFLLLYPVNEISALFIFFPAARIVEFSSGWLILLYIIFDVYGAVFQRHAGVAYLAHVAGFAAGSGIIALLLWKKWLAPTRWERTLLQVFGWMPENAEQVAPVRDSFSAANTAVRSPKVAKGAGTAAAGTTAVGTAPPPAPVRRAKPRDEGPIPLD